MIEVFKLLNGFDVVAPNTFFNRSFTGLRGHEFKLYKSSFCTNLGKVSFSNFFFYNFSFSFRIGIVYRSMLYQVTLLIHLKIDWISLTCTVGGLYKSHRLSFFLFLSFFLSVIYSLLGDFTLNYVKYSSNIAYRPNCCRKLLDPL